MQLGHHLKVPRLGQPGDGTPAVLHSSSQRKDCAFIIHTKAPYVLTETPDAVVTFENSFGNSRGKCNVFFLTQPELFLVLNSEFGGNIV